MLSALYPPPPPLPPPALLPASIAAWIAGASSVMQFTFAPKSSALKVIVKHSFPLSYTAPTRVGITIENQGT